MNVKIDYSRCEGHAVCADIAPTVFAIGEDDEQVRLLTDHPDEGVRSDVALAAKRCPTIAISVTE